MKQAAQSNMFKKASKRAHTSTAVVPPDLMSPIPSTSSAMKTPENSKAEPDDPEPAGEGNIQMESSSD